jgi:formylglycine-generating enzyme required for sulfatase activity
MGQGAMRKFFISYASQDLAWAEKVVSSLKDADFGTVCQYQDFKPGGNFVADIHRALQETQCTLLLLSPDFLRSPYTEAEWTASWALDPTSREGRLWPVMVRDCRPAGLLAALNYTNLVNLGQEEALQRLVEEAKRIQEEPHLTAERVTSYPSLRWSQAEANYRRVVSRRLDQRLSRDFMTGGGLSPSLPLRLLEPYIELAVQGPVVESGKSRMLTAFEAYSRYNKTIFLGDAGSGKSTFLRRLALDLARGGSQRLEGQGEEASRLPVLISLWSFSRSLRDPLNGSRRLPITSVDLWDYILLYSKKIVATDAADIVEMALRDGRATVLMDGLDEVLAEDISIVHEAINDLTLRAGENNRYVITCRKSTYYDEARAAVDSGYKEFDLAPLNKAQIENFVDLWEREVERLHLTGSRQDSPSLHELIERPEVRHLAESPMLLSLISRLHYSQVNVEFSRFQLFDSAIEELLWNQEKLKGDEAGDRPQISKLLEEKNVTRIKLRSCLEEISFKALEGSDQTKGVVPQSMALDALANLDDPDKSKAWAHRLLSTLKLRTGLFLTKPDVEELEFSHISFHEFMAGAHLARERNFARAVIAQLNKKRNLRETLLAAVSYLVHQQGELEVPLFLAHALCQEAGDGGWLDLLTAGDILLEMGTLRLRDVPTGNVVLRAIGQRLATLLESGVLAPTDGARVGDTLGQIGDPRFAADRFHLPQRRTESYEPLPGSLHVPSGHFLMGSIARDSDARGNEIGNTDGLVDIVYPFWISRFPVTVWQYQVFIEDRGYDTRSWWSSAGWKWRKFDPQQSLRSGDKWIEDFSTKRTRSAPLGWEEQRRFRNRPVTGVCWFEARAYAAWLERKLRSASTTPSGYEIRLPTEDEWERSARGTDGRRYPWGNEWNVAHANVQESGISHPTAVGMYPLGSSPSRAEEMVGNVQQWTLSRDLSYPYLSSDGRNRTDGATAKEIRIIRGGSFLLPASESRCAIRSRELPHSFRKDLGFRVALSIKL